ncbi:MAG: hypothetical protein AUJ47_12530 [Candidatus Marinimicrobia bacterium CG1_02_48_14]|nr:MAG: hypothetical protein AUJ47_12530 [Candidatus Marinimicrobia bacterium CG1_02_48_14]
MKRLTQWIAILPIFIWAQPATWVPEFPTNNSSVIIYYDAVSGTLPDNATIMHIHMGINGWTNVTDELMTSEGGGLWSFEYAIGPEITQIDFVFTTDFNSWDNNGSQDWHISVSEAGLYTPLNPGPNDTIRIQIANNVGGNIWWGVNSWTAPIAAYQPTGSIDGDPGLSIETPLNGPDTSGYYSIAVGPFNQPGQPVSEMNFVFHWSDGTWENNNNQDYKITMNFEPTPADPTVSMTNITEGQSLDAMQNVSVSTLNATYSEVRIDGLLRMVSSAADFSFTLNTSDLSYGKHTLYAFSRAGNNRVMFDMKTVWKIPPIEFAALPPMDYVGVHDRLDGTVTFALLAPAKRFVALIGSFNNWDGQANLLAFDSTRNIWWTNLALADGTHEYMYLLDGTKKVGDPFGNFVHWTDQFGNPNSSIDNQKTVLTLGESEFDWTDDNYQRPAMNDLIIYELLMRDFTDSRDIQGVISKLDYLQSLGINAIELMPNYEFPGTSSWGYNPAFFMAPEASYGSVNDFKQLVNEAHARGIAVLMDLVFNHVDGSSPAYQMYGTNYDDSPYIHAEQNEWGFPDLDHGREGTKLLTSRTVSYWIDQFHIDGYRYDNTTGIGWSGLNDFGISYFSYAAWQTDNDVYQVAEHFGADIGSIINATKIRSHWHDAFHDQMKANLRQGSFEGSSYGDMNKTERGINYAADGFNNLEACVNYLESHDEQRVIWEAQTNGMTYAQAVQKAKLGAATLFTAAGIPMFYMGAEFGMDTERTIDYNTLRWNYLDSPAQLGILEFYERLIWLRNHFPALRSNNVDVVAKSNTTKTIVYHRVQDGTPSVVVALNFNTTNQTLDLQFPGSGTWYEFVDDDTLTIESNWYAGYVLPASSAKIFTTDHLWLGVADEPVRTKTFMLHPAFPNPFNPSTKINWTLPNQADVKIGIYDLRGREVWTEHLSAVPSGDYGTIWRGVTNDGKQAATGVYILKFDAGTFSAAQKLILMK